MKSFLFRVLPLVALLTIVPGAPSFAQDDATPLPVPTQELFTNTPDVPTVAPTVEPTPIPTPEPAPPPVIVDQVNFRLGILGAVFGVVMLLLSGMGIGYVWGHVRASKEAKDSIELAFKSTSPETQEQIRKAHEQAQNAWNRVDEIARQIMQFWGEVTDSEPNAPTPPAQSQ